MEGIDALLQYGPLGVFAAYMLRKESLWEAEKKAQTEKYESLLKEAVARATTIDAKLTELLDDMRQLKGKGVS